MCLVWAGAPRKLGGMHARAQTDPDAAAPGPGLSRGDDLDDFSDGTQDPGLAGPGGVRSRARAVRGLLDRPLTPFYLIVGITALLLRLGLVMGLSARCIFDPTYRRAPH